MTRDWAHGTGLDEAPARVQATGVTQPLAAKGWAMPLELYRPQPQTAGCGSNCCYSPVRDIRLGFGVQGVDGGCRVASPAEAAHHHVYELAPNASELRGWHTAVIQLADLLIANQG